MRMPPSPADFIHARACKLKCEKILTRPKMCQELKLINQNLNAIIQNQNELYCKLDQLYAIAKYFGDLERTNRDKPSGS